VKYREYAPCGLLASYVKCFWTLEGAAEASSSPEPIFPDGCMEIVLNLADPFQRVHLDGRIERQPVMFLVGQMDQFTRVQSTGPVRALGVRFRPGGARPFLWFPQQEAAGQILALESVEGHLKKQFEEAALEARNDEERIARMEALLLRRLRLRPEPRIEAALCSMLAPEQPSLGAVITESGWSERQFRRRFQEVVGIAPKVFSRIIRFQRALRSIGRSGFLPAALDCGYYDQAHFIRDFKSFASETPAAYASLRHALSDHFRGAGS
jgi:AraC-like DNA-binding protein